MATNHVITNSLRHMMVYRTFTPNGSLSSTQYLPPTQFKVGISNATPSTNDTDLTNPIMIETGTIISTCAASWTGSNGGTSTTNNTTSFKEGSSATDATSQNLLANATSATKTWTLAGLTMTATKPISFWLYIKDTTALSKFLLSGLTCVELKIRTTGDGAGRYYTKKWVFTDLTTLWNYMSTGVININGLSTGVTGAPTGTLNEIVLEITTNNITDTFIAGDTMIDLVRQWATTDVTKTYVTGYPTLDLVNNEVTYRCYLNVLQANGFLVNSIGLFNQDTVPLMTDEVSFTGQSKSSTDEFSFIIKNRVI